MGGGATRAYNAARGLVENGCEVAVIAAFPHYPSGDIPAHYRWRALCLEELEGIKVIRVPVPPLASIGLANRLVLFLSFMASALLALPYVGGVDVIWAANPNIISIIPATLYGLLKRKPVALNVDDLWPEDLKSLGLLGEGSPAYKLMGLISKLAYITARIITPISPGYTKVICGKYGISPRKVHIVPAGVDLTRFKAFQDKRFNGSKLFRVLYSGAFSLAYDFDQVLRAAKRLESVNDIEFVLQGGGELARHLKARVGELGLRNVKIIDKIVSRDEVARLLNEADTLILPLRDFGNPYLGLSSKLYEYQAVGKPIICCAEGQPAEYVKETESGVVVKPGDYESLAKAVLYLRENRDVAERLGASGRRYVEENLTIERIGLRLKEIFKQFQKDKELF